MVSMIRHHELGAARMAYQQQIKVGTAPKAALDFAVLGVSGGDKLVHGSGGI